MLHAKWDVDLADRPSFTGLSFGALGLLAAALGYCRKYETDGKVPKGAPFLLRACSREHIAELTKIGEVSETESSFIFHEYLRSNEAKAQILKARKAAKQRMKNVRNKPSSVRANERRTNAFVPDSDSDSIKRDQDPEIQRDQGEVQEGEPDPVAKVDAKTRYRLAYEAGVKAGKGDRYALPREQEGHLGQVIETYARESETGDKLVGDVLLRWIYDHAEWFARWLKSEPDDIARYYSAYGPKGLLKRLNEVRRAA